ncbi:hypothetical protein F4818DRAFT_6147 [Hypoxylon cercidicola]|nr:hypothetical protein F4818DRAFT_6147 [Hypoxylon cercidicola]
MSRGTKRKANLQLSDESDSLSIKDRKSKSKRLSRLEEYNEDEGRESSRSFQRWAEIFDNNTKGEAAKSKAFMKNFSAKVEKQTSRMKEYIQEQETKLTQSKEQSLMMFKNLYSVAALPPGVSSKEGHVLFKDAQAIISGSYSLLERFREADKQLKDHKVEFPTAKWKQDKQDIKDLLASGREYGEKLVENRLAPNTHPRPRHDKYSANEKENMAAELFKDSRKAPDGDNWGTVAADQVKRLTAIAKTIPPKGPERYTGI